MEMRLNRDLVVEILFQWPQLIGERTMEMWVDETTHELVLQWEPVPEVADFPESLAPPPEDEEPEDEATLAVDLDAVARVVEALAYCLAETGLGKPALESALGLSKRLLDDVAIGEDVAGLDAEIETIDLPGLF
jgi:hypothetical protein